MYFWLKYAILAPLALAAKIVVWLLAAPIGLVAGLLQWDQLPTGLYWMQTHDAPLDGAGHPDFPRETNRLKRSWRVMNWLWRNPAYSLLYNQFGVPFAPNTQRGQWTRGELQTNRSSSGVSLRGKLGPLYIWLGWKLTNPYDDRCMLALAVQPWSRIERKL